MPDGSREAWLELCIALRNNRMEPAHAELAPEAARAYPDDALLQLEAARAHSHLGDHAAAVASCEAVLAADGSSLASWQAYAEILQAARRHEDALAAANRAVELGPRHAWSYELRGDALRRLGRYEDAAASLEETVRLAPWNLIAHAHSARCYEALGRWPDVERVVRKALAVKPAASECYKMLCEALEAQGRRDDALAATRELLERVQRLAGSFTARANFHFYLGEYEPALEAATAAMRYRRTKVKTMHIVRIESLRHLGRTAEAVTAGRQALEQHPRVAGIHLALAAALVEAGEPTEALQHVDRVLRSDPEHARAKELRARALAAGGTPK